MSQEKRIAFAGKQVDVTWDTRLCIHVAECGKATGELFVGGRKPWCQPDLSNPTDIVDIIQRCPSGALTYEDKSGGAPESAPAANSVHVSTNGPLFFRGELDIKGAPDDMPGVKFRAALCRCGASKNKPFCDNSHESADFFDYGSIGEKGTPIDAPGGPVEIEPLKDGPLVVKGNLSMYTGAGRLAWHGNAVALCRCGGSSNKPFCDGTHKKNGFKSE